jgi:hypothetical protein
MAQVVKWLPSKPNEWVKAQQHKKIKKAQAKEKLIHWTSPKLNTFICKKPSLGDKNRSYRLEENLWKPLSNNSLVSRIIY